MFIFYFSFVQPNTFLPIFGAKNKINKRIIISNISFGKCKKNILRFLCFFENEIPVSDEARVY